jgi:hypothetical protein
MVDFHALPSYHLSGNVCIGMQKVDRMPVTQAAET